MCDEIHHHFYNKRKIYNLDHRTGMPSKITVNVVQMLF